MMYHGFWWGMGWMGFFWLLVLAAVVALIAWSVLVARRSRPGGESAEAVLKRRYAHGEIDQAEYLKQLQDLRR